MKSTITRTFVYTLTRPTFLNTKQRFPSELMLGKELIPNSMTVLNYYAFQFEMHKYSLKNPDSSQIQQLYPVLEKQTK